MNQPSILSRTTSHEDIRMRDPMRELAVLTSYHKWARLEVPVFIPANEKRRVPLNEHVVRGFSLHTNENSAAARSLALPACALALAMGADVRFEPMNDTPIHRSYPSPRGLFPVDVYLIFSRDGHELRLAYDETHHALLRNPPANLSESLDGWELRIQLAVALDKIAPLYGDLAVSLCAFEIGHLTHQICAALNSLDVPFQCHTLAAPKPEDRSSHSGCSIPLVDIVLEKQRYIRPAEEDFKDSLRISTYLLNEADWGKVQRGRGWAASPASSSRVIHAAGRNCEFPLQKTAGSCHRSCGNFKTGKHGRPATDGELDALVESILEDYRVSSNGQSLRPTLTVLRTHPNFDVTVIREGEQASREVVAKGCIPLSEAYGTFYNIDVQTIPLVVTFSADFGALMKEESSWSYLEMLVLTGLYSQRVCNHAATRGFVARPFKGVKEDVLETAFNLPGQCFYTIILGKSNEDNPALSVNSLRIRTRHNRLGGERP
jgi:hypothetical protein